MKESNELTLVWLELSKKAMTFNKQKLERKRNICQSLYIGSTVYWVGGLVSLFIKGNEKYNECARHENIDLALEVAMETNSGEVGNYEAKRVFSLVSIGSIDVFVVCGLQVF